MATTKGNNNITQRIELLKKEELKLFHSYNRHAKAQVKLKILIELQTIIIKLEELELLK